MKANKTIIHNQVANCRIEEEAIENLLTAPSELVKVVAESALERLADYVAHRSQQLYKVRFLLFYVKFAI